MEAATPPTMPSQAQMAYAQRTTALHRTGHAQTSAEPPASPYKQRVPPLPTTGGPVANYLHHDRYVHQYGSGQVHFRPQYNMISIRDTLPSSQPPNRNRIPLLTSQPYLTSQAHNTDHGGIVISHASALPVDLNPPAKKLRLSDGPSILKTDLMTTPLRIETRDHTNNTSSGPGSVYNPQVEAISPTLPPDPVCKEDTTLKTVKDDLINKIGKVDKDISVTEVLITELKDKERTLEEKLKTIIEDQTNVKAPPPIQTPAQLVYAKNRELALKARARLESLGPSIDLPIYNQPMDTKIYQENQERYKHFKPRLIEYIRKRKREEAARQIKLTETYCSLATAWFKKVEKIENSNKRKARDLKAREVYEKMFPEIKKNREDKERLSRVGSRVKSDADMMEIMDGLQEQEAEDRRRHSLSVIPPIIFDKSQRRINFVNNNGKVLDYEKEVKERAQSKMWTKQEQEVFREKYIHHQKNFGLIASFLERKTPADCVEYYYLSKNREKYKRAIRCNKGRARTRGGKKLDKANHINNLNNVLPLDPIFNNTGVTTRLQREQLIKQEQPKDMKQEKDKEIKTENSTEDSSTIKEEPSGNAQANNSEPSGASVCDNSLPTSSAVPASVTSSIANSVSSHTTPSSLPNHVHSPLHKYLLSSHENATATSGATQVTSSGTPLISSTTSSNVTSSSSLALPNSSSYVSSSGSTPMNFLSHDMTANSARRSPLTSTLMNSTNRKSPLTLPNSVSTGNIVTNHLHGMSGQMELRLEIKKKERRKEDKKKDGEFDDTSDDELMDSQDCEKIGIPHECHICKKEVMVSRALLRQHASQYGLGEDDIPHDARVCANCRALRNRYTCCPLPSCVNHSTNRAKRLRLLPSKFHSLPPNIKIPIATEFQISPSITKCCSLCFTRIQKKLMSMGIGGGGSEEANSRASSPSGTGSTSPLMRWTDEETELLKKGLRECGTKWTEVSAIVGSTKTSHQCKSFYFSYRKSMGLDVLVQEYNKNHFGTERKPVLTDEEESGSSTSSCDGLIGSGALIDSDTTSAPSPSQNRNSLKPLCPPRISESSDTTTSRTTPTRPCSNQPAVNKEDYDSSATETADEGTTEQTTNSPLTVKDLMLGVIEISLKNTHGGMQSADPNSASNSKSNPPTISSILKTSDSAGSKEHILPSSNQSKPSMVVVQMSQPQHVPPSHSQPLTQREAEPVTLDLSIKKPRTSDPPFPNNTKPPAHSIPHPVTVYRTAPDGGYYHQVLEVTRSTSHGQPPPPASENMFPSSPHLVIANHNNLTIRATAAPSHHSKPVNKVRMTSLSPSQHQAHQAPSRLSPKISIMQHPAARGPHPGGPPNDRYNDSLHHGHSLKESPGGSITQGTPVHSRMYPAPSTGSAPPPEFYVKPSPTPPHRTPEPMSQPRSSSNPPPASSSPFYPPRAASYVDQQQILMSDYLTSKQMHATPLTVSAPPSAPRRNEKGGPPPPPASSAMFSYQPAARQGVIQRHNTSKPPSPHFPPPPGHEAFSSLVETAVRQPSLPVPDHKSAVSIPEMHHDKRLLLDRFNNHDRFSSSREQQERFLVGNRLSPHQQQREQQQQQQREREREQQQQREREHQQQQQREREREQQHREQQQREQQRDREHREHILLQQQNREAALREQHLMRDKELQLLREQAMMRDHQLREMHKQQREYLQMRERDHLIMADHMASRRLASETQQRIHQIQMAAFQHPHQLAAAAAAHHQREQRQTAANLSSSSDNQAVLSMVDRERDNHSAKSSASSNSDKHNLESRPQLVTAASLIDAIITHQINQPVDPAGPGDRGHLPPGQPSGTMANAQSTRPGDRLFQVDFNQKKIPTSIDQSNGKVSPAASLQAQVSRDNKLRGHDTKVAEHIDTLNKEYALHGRRTPTVYEQQQAWKLSPKPRYYDPHPGLGQSNPAISPLEYVKTRIAEVMRTSVDDKSDTSTEDHQSQINQMNDRIYSPYMMSPSPHPPSSRAPPISHLAPPTSSTPNSISSKTNDSDGKPLMSDQFEPLSDDD